MPTKRVAEPIATAVKIRRSTRLSCTETLKLDPAASAQITEKLRVESKYFAKLRLSEPRIKVEIDEALLEESVSSSAGAVKTEAQSAQFSLTEVHGTPPKSAAKPKKEPSPSQAAWVFPTEGPNVFPPVDPADIAAGQPKNWHVIYNEIVRMRQLVLTPVDAMGCERMPDTITPGTSRADPRGYRFQLLISLMLSSQTKDETNFQALLNLKHFFKSRGFPGLCLEAVLAATEQEIDACIAKVGFHRRKALYIKKTCQMIHEKFGGDVPQTIEEIISLPGVGPKMGHLLLQNGWQINLGIGVDVHIHRLAQMWGWVPKSEKPELTRTTLQDWLPEKYWADINPLLVGFGQSVCAPKANNCDVCFLANGLCKGANRKLLRAEFSASRQLKLGKNRGDLSRLIQYKLAGEE